MKTVNTLLQQFRGINVTEVIVDALVLSEQDYADRQRQQMLSGLNADGDKIGVYRDPKYKAKKFRMNPIPGLGFVDLKLHGGFYDGIFAITDNDGLRVGSTDFKSKMLEDKYGNIFTLAPVNKSAFIQLKLAPLTFQIITSKLQ